MIALAFVPCPGDPSPGQLVPMFRIWPGFFASAAPAGAASGQGDFAWFRFTPGGG